MQKTTHCCFARRLLLPYIAGKTTFLLPSNVGRLGLNSATSILAKFCQVMPVDVFYSLFLFLFLVIKNKIELKKKKKKVRRRENNVFYSAAWESLHISQTHKCVLNSGLRFAQSTYWWDSNPSVYDEESKLIPTHYWESFYFTLLRFYFMNLLFKILNKTLDIHTPYKIFTNTLWITKTFHTLTPRANALGLKNFERFDVVW